MLAHRLARELEILGAAFIGLVAIDELHDRHRVFLGRRLEDGEVGILVEGFGQLLHQIGEGGAHAAETKVLVGVGTRTAGIADVLLALARFLQRAGQGPLRAEEIDLVDGEVVLVLHVEHVLQRRVGDEAAVPVPLALDLDRREAGRQGAGGHDVLRSDRLRHVVEIDEVAGLDVDGADAEPRLLRVDQVEVGIGFERLLQRRGVVDAERLGRAGRVEGGRRNARGEEALHADRGGPVGAGGVEHGADLVAGQPGIDGDTGGDLIPEGAKLGHAFLGRVAGDQRGIDGPNRDTGDPVGMLVGIGEAFIDAALIGPQRTAALQDEDAFGIVQMGSHGSLMLQCNIAFYIGPLAERNQPHPRRDANFIRPSRA